MTFRPQTTGPLIRSPQDTQDPSGLVSVATGGSGRPIDPWSIPRSLCPAFEISPRERSVVWKPKPSGSGETRDWQVGGSAAGISPRRDGDQDTGPVGHSQQARDFRRTQYSHGGPVLKEAAPRSSCWVCPSAGGYVSPWAWEPLVWEGSRYLGHIRMTE